MISVCIATFNGEAFVKEQLLSVLNQLSGSDEIVIADDGSVDGTVAAVNSIGDKRIRWVAGGQRLGVVKNFEAALSAARGEIIFLCDQDDIWLPGKVAHCVQVLKTHLLVVTDCVVVDESLNELSPSFFAIRKSEKGIVRNLWKNSYLGCCMAFHRELLDLCLPIPKAIPMHDMWIGLLANIRGSVKFSPQKCSLYRRHGKNASQTTGKSNFGFYQKLRIRFILIVQILLRLLKDESRGSNKGRIV
ncbi:glycosyltransferase family 2 protein [Oxalicibacterium solurbis]|uniref:Alpha-L-Rha alpha-1,3-L-rhamnosyltransferase n=1 Tax=Oxalicibacterium solurbis TaxID=69280 RepID=A0A8J3AWD2_9BURK|nr:glycosyltransferase family 2 protein [Oxalicibacterium solurbis]GGI54440.1 alpha-L-Rha alpha-1,3-L-rhamnosyltransferase [Oxalicibacterium solurbis]